MSVTVRIRPGPSRGGWTRPRADALAAWVSQLAVALGLGDWEVEVDLTEPADDDADAQVAVTCARRHAVLWLSDSFTGLLPDVQARVLTHELLHCHFDPVGHTAAALVAGVLEVQPAAVHTNGLAHAIEERVDVLARALAPVLPAPPTWR